MNAGLQRNPLHAGIAMFSGLVLCHLAGGSALAESGGAVSSAGGGASSANYSITASMGDVASGKSSGGSVSNTPGAPDIQPAGVKGVSLQATPLLASAEGITQLAGSAVMEDDSITILDGSEVSWSLGSGPVASVSTQGAATLGTITEDSAAVVDGTWKGVSGSAAFYVLNGNYGTYGSSDIPDVWQVTYFGLNNPKAAPLADASGTGQNNLFKYIAGLDPTNPSSRFQIAVLANPLVPLDKKVTFSPWIGGRTYALQYSDSLAAGSWVSLPAVLPVVSGTTGTFADPAPSLTRRFYRVEINKP